MTDEPPLFEVPASALPETPHEGEADQGKESLAEAGPNLDLVALLQDLRKPFPPEAVGKLPKTTRKNVPDSEKRHCDVCGAFIGPHIHLDYVGWSTVVDRLLSHDLLWTWDAYAHDPYGLPMFRDSPNGLEVELWIRLTIAGITRPGVGIVAKNEEDLAKKLVSDALKNAANKFGIALDLWSKDELESLVGNPVIATRKRGAPKSATPVANGPAKQAPTRAGTAKPESDGKMTAQDRNKLASHLAHLEPPVVGPAVGEYLSQLVSRPVKTFTDLTAAEGLEIFAWLDIQP